MICSIIGCIYCHPDAVGAPPLPAGSLPSHHTLHSLQVLYHSGRQGNKFASLIVPIFDCCLKYIRYVDTILSVSLHDRHGTMTELRVLFLRTAVMLFIHEYHFGVAGAHEVAKCCDIVVILLRMDPCVKNGFDSCVCFSLTIAFP